jgi:AcrR family transcriptional regulator
VGQSASAGRQTRGDRTRAAIVAAALELFDRKGVEATSVDEITSAAAVAKGTFYVHFQRKQDVLLELAAEVLADIDHDPLAASAPAAIAELTRRAAQALSTAPRAVTGRMIREVIGNREQWIHVLAGRPTVAAILRPVVARGQDAGELRDDVSATRLAHSLTILWLDSVIGWSERREEHTLLRDLERATAIFLDGARR